MERAAAEEGRYAGLLYYHAARGDVQRLLSLADRALKGHPEDALVFRLLTEDTPPNAYLEMAAGAADPWTIYTLTKYALRQGDIKTAVTVALLLLKRGIPDTVSLNLVGKFLMQHGDWTTAIDIFTRSLGIAAQQRDIARLLVAAQARRTPEFELYLDPVPKASSVGFYLPVYNVEAYIRASIESVLIQCHPLDDFVVVDDGSDDGSVAIAREYPVRILNYGENRGLAFARNTAFRALSTDFVGAIDSDAVLEVGYLKYALMEYENCAPTLAGVCGRMTEIETGMPADHWRVIYMSQDTGGLRCHSDAYILNHVLLEEQETVNYNYMPGCNTLLRRTPVLDTGGYDERYRSNGEDGALVCQLKAAGYAIASTPSARLAHLRRDTIQSVLRMAWNHSFWPRLEAGYYRDIQGLEHLLEYHCLRTTERVRRDIKLDLLDCAYVSFLDAALSHLHDMRYAETQNLVNKRQCQAARTALLEPLSQLDARFGGTLAKKAAGDMEGILPDRSPEEASPVPLTHWITLCNQCNAEIYGILVN
jgi:GT2 family glycosyltransferase